MHMADALISPAVAGTVGVLSTAAAVYSIKKIKDEEDSKKIPLMGVMSAFVFAAQMINFTIPGTGSSGHLCGGTLLAALLGPFAGFISMIAILVIQCLFFADGGLLALGCNIWNMAFYSCFFGYFCIYRPIMKNGMTRKKIILASVLSSVVSLQLGAFSVVIETILSGVTELTFLDFIVFMQPIHLAIGLVEGLITAAVLLFIYETNGSLISNAKDNKISLKATLVILSVIVVFVAGGVSLIASSNPDGLEWSIYKVTGEEELETQGEAYTTSENVQEKTAFLPDYNFKDSESKIGTSLSGVSGAAIVAVIAIAICAFVKLFRRKTKLENN